MNAMNSIISGLSNSSSTFNMFPINIQEYTDYIERDLISHVAQINAERQQEERQERQRQRAADIDAANADVA